MCCEEAKGLREQTVARCICMEISIEKKADQGHQGVTPSRRSSWRDYVVSSSINQFSSVQFSRSVVSNSLRPHE